MFKEIPIKQTPLGKQRRVAVNFILMFEQALARSCNRFMSTEASLTLLGVGHLPKVVAGVPPSREEGCCPLRLVSQLVLLEALERHLANLEGVQLLQWTLCYRFEEQQGRTSFRVSLKK